MLVKQVTAYAWSHVGVLNPSIRDNKKTEEETSGRSSEHQVDGENVGQSKAA